jgi:hypothetical protein
MAEHQPRAAERRRCYLGARIIFNGGYNSLDVIVRNVSPSGALLEADDLSLVPAEFELTIASSAGESSVRRARRVWQGPGTMGVAFYAAS